MARPTAADDPPPRARTRWWWAALIGLLILGGPPMLVGLQRAILFPTAHVPLPPAHWPRPAGIERVDVTHDDGISEGWFLPGRGVSVTAPGPVVFFAHGNGELIDYAAPALEPYRARGVSVALLEYRGYGRSGGSPSEAALVEDVQRFYDAVMARPDVADGQAIAHGRSLGGGVMCGLAAHRPLKGLVLESTFRSVRLIARRFMLPGVFVADPFESEPVVARFTGPVLVMHGHRDEIIPFEHGRVLAERAADSELVDFASGHNDMPHGERYWAAIDRVLSRAGVR